MKKVLFTSFEHNALIVIWLGAVVMYPTWLNLIETPQIASGVALYFAAVLGGGEAFNFIKRAMTWEASMLVPGYPQKVWKTSLGIVGVCLAFVVSLSFAYGNFLPPIGIAALLAMAPLAIAAYSRRTGSRAVSIFLPILLLSGLMIFWSRWFLPSELHSTILVSIYSPIVQLLSFALAIVAAMVLKKEIEGLGLGRASVVTGSWERFHPKVADRLRISGWPHPSAHFAPVLLYLIPIFTIIGVSHASFAVEGSDLLESTASRWSVVVAIIVYVGTGTPFGLLKNPGLWLSKTWQFGCGRTRQALGTEFARNIVKASIVPVIVVFGVAFIHATYIEMPSADWPGFANFFDEALLLLTVNLLCFAWACASYPKRTTKCPVFIQIRIALCVSSCLIFVLGLEFGLLLRVLLVIALFGSAMLAIYVGGRLIAILDFLPIKKDINQIGIQG